MPYAHYTRKWLEQLPSFVSGFDLLKKYDDYEPTWLTIQPSFCRTWCIDLLINNNSNRDDRLCNRFGGRQPTSLPLCVGEQRGWMGGQPALKSVFIHRYLVTTSQPFKFQIISVLSLWLIHDMIKTCPPPLISSQSSAPLHFSFLPSTDNIPPLVTFISLILLKSLTLTRLLWRHDFYV